MPIPGEPEPNLSTGTVPLAIFDPLSAVKAAPLRAGRVPLAVMLAAANAVTPAPLPVRVVAATVPATVTVSAVRVIISVSPDIPSVPVPRRTVDCPRLFAALHITPAFAVGLATTVNVGPC